MQLICPNCVAQYEIDESNIPAEGRDVECASCGHHWFQDKVQMFSSDFETPSNTGSATPPKQAEKPENASGVEFTSKRSEPIPEPNDIEPKEPLDDFNMEPTINAPSSRLGQDVLNVLRSEAEYSSGQKPPAAVDDESKDTDATPSDQPLEGAIEPIFTKQEDMPLADISATRNKKDSSVEGAIEALIAEQTETEVVMKKPKRKSLTAKSNLSQNKENEPRAEYKPLNQRHINPHSDVDQLKADAKKDTKTATPLGGFLKGFKYAVLIGLLVGVLYFLKPLIVELVPQAEGVLNVTTDVVDTIARLIVYLVSAIKEMIG